VRNTYSLPHKEHNEMGQLFCRQQQLFVVYFLNSIPFFKFRDLQYLRSYLRYNISGTRDHFLVKIKQHINSTAVSKLNRS
jgi:hypothetical protein